MWSLSLIARIRNFFLLFFFVFLLFPCSILAAEVLQIRSSSLLEIGDNNRTYTVRIACLEIDPSDEIEVIRWPSEDGEYGTKHQYLLDENTGKVYSTTDNREIGSYKGGELTIF